MVSADMMREGDDELLGYVGEGWVWAHRVAL